MKLSVLLPTRNGAPYLPACIAAVLAQEAEDFELVVSDNANDDGTAEVLERFSQDRRLRVVRTDRVVPVTENWNRALEASTGDYVLMIGDDDLLLPGAIARILELVEGPDAPECLTYNAYSFVFPSSMADAAESRYAPHHFRFPEHFRSGALLSSEQRRRIVEGMYRFDVTIPLNMQTTVFSRALADSIPGGAFREPFPDHFALNAMLLRADRWLFVDERMLIVGVSPKSFGHFVYGSDQDAGLSYLGIDTAFPGWLPGNELLSAMYLWLELLRKAFPSDLAGVEVSRGDYVARQLWWLAQQRRTGRISRRALWRALRRLSGHDWASAARAGLTVTHLRQVVGRLRAGRGDPVRLVWQALVPIEGVTTITELAAVIGPVDAQQSIR